MKHEQERAARRHETRRLSLLLLIAEAGGRQTDLAEKVGTPNTHISAMASGHRGMGDHLAAKFEAMCGKPEGWMDQSHSEAPPVVRMVARLIKQSDALLEAAERLAREASPTPDDKRTGVDRRSAERRRH